MAAAPGTYRPHGGAPGSLYVDDTSPDSGSVTNRQWATGGGLLPQTDSIAPPNQIHLFFGPAHPRPQRMRVGVMEPPPTELRQSALEAEPARLAVCEWAEGG